MTPANSRSESWQGMESAHVAGLELTDETMVDSEHGT